MKHGDGVYALCSRVLGRLKSAVGITIMLAVALTVFSTLDKGLYVLLNIVITGGMWALMAIGLALMFGVMNISNFAHGEYFMIGTLVAYYIFTPLHKYLGEHPNVFLTVTAPLIAIVGATLFGALAGAVTEKLVFYRLRIRTKEEWIVNCFLLTLGLSVILVNGHQLIFGTAYKGIVSYWNCPPLLLLGVFISVERLFASMLALTTIVLFWIFMKFSRIGRAMRAVAQDEKGALMVGISVNAIQTFTLALSGGMAALAGASLIFMYPSYPTVGLMPLYDSWFVILVVGFGNVIGAIPGGFIVALLQTLTRVYVGEGWGYVIPVILISAILVFKPSGIFGSKVAGVWEK